MTQEQLTFTTSKEVISYIFRYWPSEQHGTWLLTQPDLQTAWKTCPRCDWLVATLVSAKTHIEGSKAIEVARGLASSVWRDNQDWSAVTKEALNLLYQPLNSAGMNANLATYIATLRELRGMQDRVQTVVYALETVLSVLEHPQYQNGGGRVGNLLYSTASFAYSSTPLADIWHTHQVHVVRKSFPTWLSVVGADNER